MNDISESLGPPDPETQVMLDSARLWQRGELADLVSTYNDLSFKCQRFLPDLAPQLLANEKLTGNDLAAAMEIEASVERMRAALRSAFGDEMVDVTGEEFLRDYTRLSSMKRKI